MSTPMERIFSRLSTNTRYIAIVLFIGVACFSVSVNAQTREFNGQVYTLYKAKYFKPKKGLSYSFYLSPVLTVDPLGVRGQSTYAFGGGMNLTLWESKSASNALGGLKIQSFYIGTGYENYPEQFDKLYFSFGMRIKTFMPLAARMERIIDIDQGKLGTSVRFCLGFEINKVTVFLSGTTGWYPYDHPVYDTKYSNVGAILLVIPVYSHIGKFRK
jgi:hypothetical protein